MANNSTTSTWVEGDTFVKATVTVGTGEVMNVVYEGTGSDDRGFLSNAQIVLIPEPGSLALVGLGGLMMLKRRSSQA